MLLAGADPINFQMLSRVSACEPGCCSGDMLGEVGVFGVFSAGRGAGSFLTGLCANSTMSLEMQIHVSIVPFWALY